MRFYNNKKIVWDVKGKNGQKRRPTIYDAKKNDWKISVSTVAKYGSDSEALTNWFKTTPLKVAASEGDWSLLKTAPESWYQEMIAAAEEEMGKGAQLGSRVHKCIEKYFEWIAKDMKGELDVTALYQPYVKAVHNFCGEFSVKPKKGGIEKVVEDEATWTAGTLDMQGQGFGNKNVVFDWKTQKVRSSPRFYFNYKLQIAAYRKMVGPRGIAALIVVDTSGHPYKNGDLPKVYSEIIESSECKKLYGYYKDLARIVYASLGWERE